jgi:hypothetical protein
MSKLLRSFGFLLVALLLSAWTMPAAGFTTPDQSAGLGITVVEATGGTARLTVNNQTGAVMPKLVLNGGKTYTFYNVPQGKSQYDVLKGSYKFEYQACGAKKSKKVNIQSNTKFSTVKCAVSKIQMNNQTGSNMYLTLTGPSTYRLTIPPGNSPITVLKGSYQYTMQTSCGTDSGTINLKGKMRWTWWCN